MWSGIESALFLSYKTLSYPCSFRTSSLPLSLLRVINRTDFFTRIPLIAGTGLPRHFFDYGDKLGTSLWLKSPELAPIVIRPGEDFPNDFGLGLEFITEKVESRAHWVWFGNGLAVVALIISKYYSCQL